MLFNKSTPLFFALIISQIFADAQSDVVSIPGLSSFTNLRDYCISADGTEDFFTIQSPNGEISQIATRKKINGEWSAPELLPFCNANMYLEPFLTQDGLRLYFVSDRPYNESDTTKKDFDICYVDRSNKNESWSAPKHLDAPVNSTNDEFYPSVTLSGDIYFTMAAADGMGKDDIYYCKYNNGKYDNPQILPAPVNSAGYEFNAFISPDGNTLIYTKYNAPGGLGSGDLYVAKKDAQGVWGMPVNIQTPVNTMYMEYCPYYDFKTSTLYFTSRRCSLTPKSFHSVSDLQQYISEGENGWSRLYTVKMQL